MRTTLELPDDLFRKAKARAALQGRTLKDIVADGLDLLLQTPKDAPSPSLRTATRKRGSAGAWVKRFAGVAKLAPGETTDDARADHYQKKYGA